MLEKLNIDQMCHAYRLLFETETRLRQLIEDTLKHELGYFWYRNPKYFSPRFNFISLNYHELISIIRKFPTL